jgi:hypothetical protein
MVLFRVFITPNRYPKEKGEGHGQDTIAKKSIARQNRVRDTVTTHRKKRGLSAHISLRYWRVQFGDVNRTRCKQLSMLLPEET